MDTLIKNLMNGSEVEMTDSLLAFMDTYGTHLNFEELNKDNLRKDLWEALFKCLEQAKYFTIHEHCLRVLRILSRDKTNLDDLITSQRLNLVINNAALGASKSSKCTNLFTNVTTESLKLLCNLLYNSTAVRKTIAETTCLRCIVNRMANYDETTPHEVKLFDARIIFLATALDESLRNIVKNELNGDVRLVNILHSLSMKFESKGTSIEDDIALACEILKGLFNLYINSDDCSDEPSDSEKALVKILYKLLVDSRFNNSTKEDELLSNIVNLLTVIPYSCYHSIIEPSRGIDGETTYESMNMTAVAQLLNFLDERLNTKTDLVENISPVITALIRLVKSERLIRKYVRLQVLPPLRDVMKRPEEGSTLRAKLCKLLTSPLASLCDLVAEFIFVLCKENVGRMVKYTGYGNAAGMFANKGLLGRGQPSESSTYSSESEDSDTEEYVKYKENINPVTGCYEQPKRNPLEGMSEEQKEYEAMKLVGLVDELTRRGIVQPCRIGGDGKPKPIEHILELQEELPKLNINKTEH